MTELCEDDKLKYRLYNLSNYIKIFNVIHVLFTIYNLIYYIYIYNFDKIFIYLIHLFLITPIIFFSIKFYLMTSFILIEIYKICFSSFKLFQFYQGNYYMIEIEYILIDLYSIYFIFKYVYYISNCDKEIIFILRNNWKPEKSMLYFY